MMKRAPLLVLLGLLTVLLIVIGTSTRDGNGGAAPGVAADRLNSVSGDAESDHVSAMALRKKEREAEKARKDPPMFAMGDAELPPLEQSDPRVERSILSRRAIRPNWQAMEEIRRNGQGMLAIPTDGSDGILTARIDRVIPNWGGGYSLSGSLKGWPLGTFLATVHGDAVVANIRTGKDPSDLLEIASVAEGVHELRERNLGGLPSCDGEIVTPEDADEVDPQEGSPVEPSVGDVQPQVAADDVSTVDVMIVYTAAARGSRGGTNGMIASINQAINESNTAFGASGVSAAFRLAHAEEISYEETSDSSVDLSRLRSKTDGHMDEVHALRNTHSADIVSLWTQSSYSGIGYVMGRLTNSFESSAFNVCDIDYAVSSYTLAHECGHNMGSAHDIENASSGGLYSYSYGWRWYGTNGNRYRSVMAYTPGSRVLRFSNPSVTYNGGVTGSETANNALSLNNARATAAAWRVAPVSVFEISPLSQDAGESGGSFSFNVTATGSWSWTSSGGSGWLTSSEATVQTGNQTFTYVVAPNSGTTSRTASFTLTSGSVSRTFTVTQAGSSRDDHGDSMATATVVLQNSITQGNIGTPGDADFFRINVTAAGTLAVYTTGTTDTYGTLFDASGLQLESNDDAETANFRISRVVTPGTYYVRVAHSNLSGGTGSYQLVCSLSTSTTLSLDPASLTFPTAGGTGAFEVYSNGAWTWSSSASWVTSSKAASQTGNQAFLYNVAGNTSASSRTATITLVAGSLRATHTVIQPGTTVDDHGNTPATATLVAQNSTTSGNIETPGDNDYFRINVTTTGVLTVGTTGETDTFGHLLNASGSELAYNDDTNGSNFRIVQQVTAGTYYVRVRHYDTAATGAYQLVCSFAPGGGADDHGDSMVAATLVGENSTTRGTINYSLDVDFFRIDVTARGTLTVGTTGSTDTYGLLMDSGGTVLA